MQIDVGFGDAITPEASELSYPTILDPRLKVYPRETVVAEKLEAMTSLGLLNSRLKDYFDLWLLSSLYSFEGAVLVRAVQAIFTRRATRFDASPIGLTASFSKDTAKLAQWGAFIRRSRLTTAPTQLSQVVEVISRVAKPVLAAASMGEDWPATWTAGASRSNSQERRSPPN